MNATLFQLVNLTLASGLVALAGASPVLGQDSASVAGPPPAVPSEEMPAGTQVLTRGQVHEAFAQPVTLQPQTPLLVPKAPPVPLQEIPPAEKPAGADIVWVAGYWAWDEDRHDFIYISGCWRHAPPQTYWVPGHWLQTGDGWQWIAGFWKPIGAQPQDTIEYLPAPPAAVEIEAKGRPPLASQIWVPDCWYWVGGRYVHRSGYWITPQVGWVWVPSHYLWTPRGYIFCPGHWDYDLDNRGVLFTPAYFPPEVRGRPRLVFCPTVCVDLGMLRLNLFTYPRYHHYCFGDYYDDVYLRVGIYPWFRCQTIHTWYDPIFVYDYWHVGHQRPDWTRRYAQDFQMRRADRDLRPARTYAEFEVQMKRMPAAKRPERSLVQPVKAFAGSSSTPARFERITPAERQQFAGRSTEVADLRDQRKRWESPTASAPSPSTPLTRPSTTTKQVPAPPSPTARAPSAPSVTRRNEPAKSSRSEPAPAVRVTRPEQVTIPTRAAAPQAPASRYIEKQAPVRPTQEQVRTGPTPTPKAPGRERATRSQPNDSRGGTRSR